MTQQKERRKKKPPSQIEAVTSGKTRSSSKSKRMSLGAVVTIVLALGFLTMSIVSWAMYSRLSTLQSENRMLSTALSSGNKGTALSSLPSSHRRRGAGHLFDQLRSKAAEESDRQLKDALKKLTEEREKFNERKASSSSSSSSLSSSSVAAVMTEEASSSPFNVVAVVFVDDSTPSWSWRASSLAYDFLHSENARGSQLSLILRGVVIVLARLCPSQRRPGVTVSAAAQPIEDEQVWLFEWDACDSDDQMDTSTPPSLFSPLHLEAEGLQRFLHTLSNPVGELALPSWLSSPSLPMSAASLLLLEAETLIGNVVGLNEFIATVDSSQHAEKDQLHTTLDTDLYSLSESMSKDWSNIMQSTNPSFADFGTFPVLVHWDDALLGSLIEAWSATARALDASLPLSDASYDESESWLPSQSPSLRRSLLARAAFAGALARLHSREQSPPSIALPWSIDLSAHEFRHYASVITNEDSKVAFFHWRSPMRVWLQRAKHWHFSADDWDFALDALPSPRPIPLDLGGPVIELTSGPGLIASRISDALVYCYGAQTVEEARELVKNSIPPVLASSSSSSSSLSLSAPFEQVSIAEKQERLLRDGALQSRWRERFPAVCRDDDNPPNFSCQEASGHNEWYLELRMKSLGHLSLDRAIDQLKEEARVAAVGQSFENPNYQSDGEWLDEPIEGTSFLVHALRRVTPITRLWPSFYVSHNKERDWEQLLRARFGDAQFERSAHEIAQAQALQQALYAAQHPVDCKSAKFVYVDMRHPGVLPGLGTFLVESMRGLLLAFNTGRVLVVSTHSFYWARDNEECDQRAYTCYWSPVSHCTEADFGIEDYEYTPLWRAQGHEKVLITYGAQFGMEPEHFEHCVACRHALPQSVREFYSPRACPRCTNSRFWIDAQFARYLFREPSDAVQGLVDMARAHLQFDEGGGAAHRYGFHIRRTDKVKGPIKESVAHAFDSYLFAAARLTIGRNEMDTAYAMDSASPLFIEQSQEEALDNDSSRAVAARRLATADDLLPRHAFVSSDEARILSEAESMNEILPHVQRVLFDEVQPRIADGAVTSAHLGKEFDATSEALHGFKDMLLLANCSVFVGSGSSFFTRAALRLFVSSPGQWFERVHAWSFVEESPWGDFPYGHDFQF